MMYSRRGFLKISLATGAGLMLPWQVDLRRGPSRLPAVRLRASTVQAAFSSPSLDPATIKKYDLPLVIPPAMPQSPKTGAAPRNIDYYEIAVRQFAQQILPQDMPMTTVWGYGSANHPNTFNYPSFTIEASVRRPVRVKWINQLVDANGNYLPHLLPVDPTLHWANPPGGVAGRDRRPTFASTPDGYTGPVPLVTHVHGAAGVGDESDGYTEAWYLPAATNIPAGYATEGTWYDYFKNKALAKFGETWSPGSATFQYPNEQRAGTLWYHDHALGMTRLNVYAGPAGFYVLRGGPDDVVRTRRGGRATLPGPAPAAGDKPGTRYYEIPLAIQDRSFNADGSLFYPDSRAFFDGVDDYIPDTEFSPIWNPEFFGNTVVVNGRTWPYLEVEPRRYRFRILNGCDARFLILDFGAIPQVEVWQIGNEGGFLAEPVNLTAVNGNRLLMGPAERADVIVDFTSVPGGSYVLGNVGPDEPFGGGDPDVDFPAADPNTTGQVMQFRVVVPLQGKDKSTPPADLRPPKITVLTGGSTRRLALLEMMSMGGEEQAPVAAMLGVIDQSGNAEHKMWMDQVTENPIVGASEVWEFYNLTADAHPMHVHEVLFQVVNRERLVLDGEEVAVPVQLTGAISGPEPWENGFKDTVIAYPGAVTRVRARFNTPGQFVWHCHIVEHEDNEMMRPYRIGPPDPNAPA